MANKPKTGVVEDDLPEEVCGFLSAR